MLSGTLKELRTNTICYGEMPDTLKCVMQDIGPENFKIRSKVNWCKITNKHYTFNNERTYQLSENYKLAVGIVFEAVNGQWGMMIDICFISYDSAASLICLHGDNVRFMGYCYSSDLNHYVGDMMSPNGELPKFGVWEVL